MSLHAESADISLLDIVAVLAKHWVVIAVCCALTLILGALFAFVPTPLYTASVTVQPAGGTESEGLLSQLAGRLGPAAALIGANIGGGASRKDEFLGVLNSRRLGVQFVRERKLLPNLFPDRWDAKQQQWIPQQPGQPADAAAPTDSEIFREFEKILTIDEDADTGLITVAFEVADPQLAAQSADAYVALANRAIRDTAVQDASRALDYLNARIAETQIADLRIKMYDLVETQLETVTLASARADYAFRIVDPAIVPDLRSFPRRGLTLLVSLVAGLALGSLIALVRDFYASRGSRRGAV